MHRIQAVVKFEIRTMLFATLEKFIKKLNSATITQDRKESLQPLIDYIRSKVITKQTINLNFICTHNSRRSHLAQVWAQTMACFYKIKNVQSYSGGTEATALFPMIAQTLRNSGFKIEKLSGEKNPKYNIKYAENESPIIGFSKKYDDPFNPSSHFTAILTCSQADDECPFITGAEKRIPITYQDPKISDGTPFQESIYKERSIQIATEMKYVFSKIKQI